MNPYAATFTLALALAAALGGVILGVASTLLFAVNGRILGVSGIVGELPAAPAGDRGWRAAFLAGLLGGGALLLRFAPGSLALPSESSVPVAIVAGVVVAVGSRLGNGCTSGHGLCGLARLSRRSLVATGVFMATAALTVFVTRHGWPHGGSPAAGAPHAPQAQAALATRLPRATGTALATALATAREATP